jgi:predicted transcriptional regulator YheO
MYKTFLVHRLVAAAFVGDQPSKKHEVAHNDGDRLNNVSSNLRWVLHTENMQDRDRHGTTATGSRNGKFKHPDTTVVRVRELQASGLGSRRISKMLGMSRGTVYSYMKNTRRQSIEHRGQQS